MRYTIKAKKEQLNVEYKPDVGALSGWGGEMMINAKKETFIHRTMDNFPTMGYIFDATMWARLEAKKKLFFGYKQRPGNDWAVRIGDLYRGGHMAEATQRTEPATSTLTRTWGR